MINLDYKSGVTLHEQIEEGIRQLIISGALAPDTQLPSVRELSVSLTVNPNTVQRAYKQLEQDRFIYSIKGKGNFVTSDFDTAGKALCEQELAAFEEISRKLAMLGEDKEKLISVIEKAYSEKEGAL